MAVYPDAVRIEFYISSAWVDKTTDVVRDNITGQWGITGNTAIDLLADTGTLNFTLNNENDLYIPGHTSALTRWDKGTAVRLVIRYDGVDYVRFRGTVDTLDVISGIAEKWVKVTCVDWMDYAAKYPLVTPTIQTSKRADEAITTIVAGMPIAPQSTSYETGQETFDTVFDNVSPATKAYSEFAKLVKSEFGYLYSKKDKVNGEKLFFEDRHYRHGLRALNTIQISDGDVLLLETGDSLLLETGDKLLLNEGTDALFDNTMQSVEIQYGRDIVNRFTTLVYPKEVSAAVIVCFSLDKEIEIGSGVTIEFRSNYSDPTGGTQMTVDDTTMLDPVDTTDYLMNDTAGGGGADLTADLTVTAAYGTEGVSYTLYNGNAKTGYITKLQARGKGITVYNPIENRKENTASINSFGYQTQAITQKYKQVLDLGILIGKKTVATEKDPRLDLQKVTFSANRNAPLMYAFLDLDVGSLVRIKENDAEIDGYYYIQAVEFSIAVGGIIHYTWMVKEMNSLISTGSTSVGVEYGATGATDGINYGYLPHCSDLTFRTMSAWIYLHLNSSIGKYIVVVWGDFGAAGMFITDLNVQHLQKHTDANQSRYITTAEHLTINTLHHICVTKDTSDVSNAPIIYVDGVSRAVTETEAGVNPITTEVASNLVIGNLKTSTVDYIRPFDGVLYDPRIYDVVLTPTQVTTLYNSGTIDESLVTDNLVFQGFTVNTKKYSGLLNSAMTVNDAVTDNIFGYVGEPNGTPVIRAVP